MINLDHVTAFSELLAHEVPGINHFEEALDVDHITTNIASITSAMNDVLYLMTPQYHDDLTNADAIKSFVTVDWFVLRKTNSKGGRKAHIDNMKGTLASCAEIRAYIFRYSRGEGVAACGGWLRNLFPDGDLSITPVYHMAQLFGWHIRLVVKSYG